MVVARKQILIVFGTRPEIIKLGTLCVELQKRCGVDVDVFSTGQHIELARGLLELFDIRVTHNGSDVMAHEGLASKAGAMLQQVDSVLRRKRYDWLVVQGDTTTAQAAAVAGFLNRVPVAHVEAGLRTGSLYSPWPEEFNRRVVTLASTLHFAPTPQSRDNLLAEGVQADCVQVVGNTVVDALLHVRNVVGSSYVPKDPAIERIDTSRKLVLVTTHRRENIGEPMRQVLRALRDLAADGDKSVVLPVHLNPSVKRSVTEVLGDAPNVHVLAPLQYTDFVYLLSKAWVVVTDSGGVQEEAPTFNLPIVITRDTTERPEVVTAGFGRLVGCDYDEIVRSVRALTAGRERKLVAGANPFGDGRASVRIAEALLGEGIAVDATTPRVATAV